MPPSPPHGGEGDFFCSSPAAIPESPRRRLLCRGRDLAALLAVLDPDVVLRVDPAAVRMGASAEVRGAAAVADTFKGRARAAQRALLNGAAGLVWASGGEIRFLFTIRAGKIADIELIADPEHIARVDISVADE